MISVNNGCALNRILLFTIILLCLSFYVSPTYSDEDRGLQISLERKKRDEGWHDSVTRYKMVLNNKQGEQSIRKLDMKSLETQGDGDKTLIIFDEPKDIKGTALLSYSHAIKPDDQWLFLPSLRRVKRIASRNKSGPFMGSEFAYEDLGSFEIEKYRYRYLDDEILSGQECFVVDQTPLDEYSGYTHQKVWIDKVNYLPIKIEYYDRKESLLKTLKFEDYKQQLGAYWRSYKMTMENHQTGNTTVLVTLDQSFQVGLNEGDFSQASLKRTR